jgi:cyclopropane fatty-acyl-phospholipid synthase-like methyltransferase
MSNYDKFYKHYDAVMGDPKQKAVFLKSLIDKWHPKATTLMELACGTGAVLQYFAHNYDVSGVDLSKGMLSIAKKRLPKASFFRQDMTQFAVPGRLDVILCVYDSINHLVHFNDWQNVFARVKHHLNAKGVFIFDVNTVYKLDSLAKSPTWFHQFEKNYLAMSVQGKPHNLTNWNIKVFENVGRNKFRLYEENIQEKAFSASKIQHALRTHFKRTLALDPQGRKPTRETPKIFFVCQD